MTTHPLSTNDTVSTDGINAKERFYDCSKFYIVLRVILRKFLLLVTDDDDDSDDSDSDDSDSGSDSGSGSGSDSGSDSGSGSDSD